MYNDEEHCVAYNHHQRRQQQYNHQYDNPHSNSEDRNKNNEDYYMLKGKELPEDWVIKVGQVNFDGLNNIQDSPVRFLPNQSNSNNNHQNNNKNRYSENEQTTSLSQSWDYYDGKGKSSDNDSYDAPYNNEGQKIKRSYSNSNSSVFSSTNSFVSSNNSFVSNDFTSIGKYYDDSCCSNSSSSSGSSIESRGRSLDDDDDDNLMNVHFDGDYCESDSSNSSSSIINEDEISMSSPPEDNKLRGFEQLLLDDDYDSPKGVDDFPPQQQNNNNDDLHERFEQFKSLYNQIRDHYVKIEEQSPPEDEGESEEHSEEEEVPLSKDPRFSRYFLMLRARVPYDQVRKVVEMDGLHSDILDLDPHLSYESQMGDDSPYCLKTIREQESSSDTSTTATATDDERANVDERSSASSQQQHSDDDGLAFDSDKIICDITDIFTDYDNSNSPRVYESVEKNQDVEHSRPARRKISDIAEEETDNNGRYHHHHDNYDVIPRNKTEYNIQCQRFNNVNSNDSDSSSSSSSSSFLAYDDDQIICDLSEFFTNCDITGRDFGVEYHNPMTWDERRTVISELMARRNASTMTMDEKKANISALLSARHGDNTDSLDNRQQQQQRRSSQRKRRISSSSETTARQQQDSTGTTTDKDELNSQLLMHFQRKTNNCNNNAEQQSQSTNAKNVDAFSNSLKEDPEYKKYFNMIKMGVRLGAVKQAMIKDGKHITILDLDPETSLATQRPKEQSKIMDEKKIDDPTSSIPLKEDPKYQKYFKMLKLGVRLGAVKQAMVKDGKDSTILDLDPEKSLASQRPKEQSDKKIEDDPSSLLPLKKDPEYMKYFKMINMGVRLGAVKQSMVKDGKNSSILDLDPEKSLESQRSKEQPPCTDDEEEKINDDPSFALPLKEHPDYKKYFKMLKLGVRHGAAKQAMVKDGKDSTILDLDPEKSLAIQSPKAAGSAAAVQKKQKKDKVVRKRLFWNSIDNSKQLDGSIWSKFQDSNKSLDLTGLDYDEKEFADLFTLDEENVDGKSNNKKTTKLKTTQTTTKKKSTIHLIDSRRQLNGSILLRKYNVDCKILVQKIDAMDSTDMSETLLLGLMQLLPSKDEALAIRSYLPTNTTPEEKEAAISVLGECENYMVAMLEVDNAAGKLKFMTYRVQFQSLIDNLKKDFKTLQEGLTCVRNSDRLTRLMLIALKLGNTLNEGRESGRDVVAITLDSLLKLQEAKAFDNKTSVLQYLVMIIEKNDKDILKVCVDLKPAIKAQRVMLESLTKAMNDLRRGLQSIVKSILEEEKGNNNAENSSVKMFVMEAKTKLDSLSEECQKCKNDYANLLVYFGENPTMPSNEFFNTISRFITMFENSRSEIRQLQKAKARKEQRRKPASKKNGNVEKRVSVVSDNNFYSDRSAVLHAILLRGKTN